MSGLKRSRSLSRVPVSTRGRSTIAKFMASPFSAQKNMAFRSRSLSCGGPGSAKLNFQSPKQKSEKTKAEALSIVIKFLSERDYSLPFKSNYLPTIKDFRDVCVFLIGIMDPKKAQVLQCSKDFETDFIYLLNALQYPKKINRSAIRTVNTNHGWLALLPVLMWLVKLIELFEHEMDSSPEEALDDAEKLSRISQKLTYDILSDVKGTDVESLKCNIWSYAEKLFHIDSNEMDCMNRSKEKEKENVLEARKTLLQLQEEEQRYLQASIQKKSRIDDLEMQLNFVKEEKFKLEAEYAFLAAKPNQNEQEAELQAAIEQLTKEQADLLGTHGRLEKLEYAVQNLQLEEAQVLKDYDNLMKHQCQVMQEKIAKKKRTVDIVTECNEALINMNLFEGLKVTLDEDDNDEMKLNELMKVEAQLEERTTLLAAECQQIYRQEKELVDFHRGQEEEILQLSSQKTILKQGVAELKKNFSDLKSEIHSSISMQKETYKGRYSKLMALEELDTEVKHLKLSLETEQKNLETMAMSDFKIVNETIDNAVSEKLEFKKRMSLVYDHYEKQQEQLQEIDLTKLRETLGVTL